MAGESYARLCARFGGALFAGHRTSNMELTGTALETLVGNVTQHEVSP